jgi:monooxygenase
MATQVADRPIAATSTEHFDVLIVGAGISGIGGGYHLKDQCPDKSFVILEAKDTFGGTWETHKYPGIRSDSDLYTFGYRFKPWVDDPIAKADKILRYLDEVIIENGLDAHIRYGHRITRCSWSSADNLWTVEATDKASGDVRTFTCGFLWMCQGYYNHETPYFPKWPGMENYKGLLVHAQKWDPATNTRDKRVIVIGSGASAATIVPALAGDAAHVTMLQRTPTWFYASPNEDLFAVALRGAGLDDELIHRVVRDKINHNQDLTTRMCVEQPDVVQQDLFMLAKMYLGQDYDMAPHFTPSYRPWQQRLAMIPDGDLFQAVAKGEASVVTDEIDTFTETGIRTKSGEHLEADIIIAATGFDLSVMGGIPFFVDDHKVDWADTVTYRGMMFTGVPNMLWVFGYFRTSWTMRVDLLGDFVCKLLKAMDAKGAARVDVKLRPEDHNMPILPWVSEDNFNPGYIRRGIHLLPKRGDKPEWMHNQDYWSEKDQIPAIDLDGAEFHYS